MIEMKSAQSASFPVIDHRLNAKVNARIAQLVIALEANVLDLSATVMGLTEHV
jgi:hypothetical protein